ncbi:MAG: DUF1449 family protein [Coleofasciculus sp. G1-WW12-02]|uniref:DUF1449 domain-containing protein n=1 Tax=unclassified Coleofasciculus TaxID=2692782 RepID=UPI003302BEC7
MLFNLLNLPYWIFLGMGVLLFLVVIVSGGGDDDFDFDVDADADIDVDTGGDFAMGSMFGLLGVGKVPLILLLATDCSLVGLFGWMMNVAIANVTGTIPTGLLGGVVGGASLVLSLFCGGLISRPLGKIFADFGEDASGERLIGCQGTVSSRSIPLESQGKIGQVDVLDPNGNLVTINATLPQWAKIIPNRGNYVLVIERQPESYRVITKDSSDQQQWLSNSSQLKDSP